MLNDEEEALLLRMQQELAETDSHADRDDSRENYAGDSDSDSGSSGGGGMMLPLEVPGLNQTTLIAAFDLSEGGECPALALHDDGMHFLCLLPLSATLVCRLLCPVLFCLVIILYYVRH